MPSTPVHRAVSSCFFTGPHLPAPRFLATAVPFDDTFLLIGGYRITTYRTFERSEPQGEIPHDTVLMFDPKEEKWVTLDDKLATPRAMAAAAIVPRSIVDAKCS